MLKCLSGRKANLRAQKNISFGGIAEIMLDITKNYTVS